MDGGFGAIRGFGGWYTFRYFLKNVLTGFLIHDIMKGVKDMEKRHLFECEECKARFYIGNGGIELKYGVPFKTKDGRSIFVTYYDCPVCDRRHYVQIDDAHSNQMKKETSRMFIKLSKKRLDFRDIPKSQNEKFKKLNKKLESYRLELKRQLNGQIIVSENGAEVEVYFSV